MNNDMNKAGRIRIIQTEEACKSCSHFLIEYFEIEDGKYKVMYEHDMSWWDLQYAFNYLHLGLNYNSVFAQSVKLESIEFISWCRLMKRLIGTNREHTFFIQEEQFKEFSDKLRKKSDKSQIGVIITRRI